VEELAKCPGMNRAVAAALYRHLHGDEVNPSEGEGNHALPSPVAGRRAGDEGY
jgi:hypothetical protein